VSGITLHQKQDNEANLRQGQDRKETPALQKTPIKQLYFSLIGSVRQGAYDWEEF